MNKNSIIQIWTDGACSFNPGPGGWGCLLRFNGQEKQLSGFEDNTTNNRMELTACIKALEALKTHKHKIIVTTDSKYVMDGITQWIKNWKLKDYKKVKNDDLWRQLDVLNEKLDIEWKWVKGHSSNPENDLCDKLATDEVKNNRTDI